MTAPGAPIWLAPAAPGQMTNKRGTTRAGADDILLKVRYSNVRASGDQVSMVRFLALQTPAGGSPQVVLDTWWMGAGTIAAPPGISPAFDIRTNSSFIYDPGSGPRVYVAGRVRDTNGGWFYSAPISGPSIGTWRQETGPRTNPLNVAPIPSTVYSIAQASGYIYAVANTPTLGQLYYAPINSDGTFGAWVKSTVLNAIVAADTCLFSFSDASGNYLYAFSAGNTNTRGAKVNADGTLGTGNAWVIGGSQPAQKGYCGAYFAPSGFGDGNGTLWLIGGWDGVNASLSIVSAPVTLGTGLIGAWVAAGTGIPVVRANPAFAFIDGWLYLVGGSSSGNPVATGTTTVYRLLAANLGTTVWTTDATALTAASFGGGAVASFSPYDNSAVGSTTRSAAGLQGNPTFWAFGTNASVGATWHTLRFQTDSAAHSMIAATKAEIALFPSTGAELATAHLGNAGVVTNNADGTVDVTYAWGAVGYLLQNLADGDVITISAQFCDVQGGDPSPAVSAVFKVGQPPTLASVLPAAAIATGRPVASFQYIGGAGGGSQASWQVTVKIGATVYFDSGLRRDLADAVLVDPPNGQLLLTATAYTFTWTATSTDDVFNGATNTVTSTLAVTPTMTVVAAPTTLAAVPDSVNGLVNLTWVNPTPPGTPGNRVYYRVNGTAPWLLLKHSAVQIAAFAAMDQLALGVGYDFAVSQLGLVIGAEAESVLSNIVANVKIQPYGVQWGGAGFTAMLHVAGNGPAQHAGLLLDGAMVSADRVVETVGALMMGGSALTPRYGKGNYRLLKVPHIMRDSTAAVDALIDAGRTGSTLCFRDKTGLLVYCAPGAARPRSEEVWPSGHSYFHEVLELTEVAFTFTP